MNSKKSKIKSEPKPEQISEEFISKSEFGRRLKVARNTVIKAIKEERIQEVTEGEHKGKIEFHSQKIAFEENKDSSKDRSSKPSEDSNAIESSQANSNSANSNDHQPKPKITLTEARKLYLAEQTRQKKLQNDLAERKVVEIQIVEELLFKATRLLRDNTFQIFPRVIPLWAGALQNYILQSLTGKIPEDHLKTIIASITIQDLERLSSDLWNTELTRILEDFSHASKL